MIIVTDALAWPLALWTAATLGHVTLLRNRTTGRPTTVLTSQ